MDEYEKFWKLLSNFPSLEKFWDKDKREIKEPDVFLAPRYLSSGETIILKCLISIWSGSTPPMAKIGFSDLATIDAHHRKPLIEWLCNPSFP